MDDRTKTKLVVKAIQNITGGATKFLLVNNEISSLEWKEVDIEKPSESKNFMLLNLLLFF